MKNLSLEERKRRLIEDCCGGTGGEDSDSSIGDDTASAGADAEEAVPGLDRVLNKLKKKRRSKLNGT